MKESTVAAMLMEALRFAADKHREQRRKDSEASPFINHPIEVAEVLARVGQVDDVEILRAALLHDTVEDTETTPEELEIRFGSTVCEFVLDVTDDQGLPKEVRKRLQIEQADGLSAGAKQIKIADKTCNVRDVTHAPPRSWSLRRRIEYLDWTERVVAGCRGCNTELERHYDDVLREAREVLSGQSSP